MAGLLAADELERQEGDARRPLQTAEERAQWPDLAKLKPRGMAEDHHHVLGGELEAQHAVRRLTEWHGDIRLGDLTRELARDFRDALATVPTRLPDNLKRLPMRELLAKDLKAFPSVHATTVNKTLTILAAIISHAEAAGRLDAVAGFKNPFGKGIKLGDR